MITDKSYKDGDNRKIHDWETDENKGYSTQE